MMRHWINWSNGVILLGTLLIVGSLLPSLFDLLKPPESPIDRLDNSEATLIIPTSDQPGAEMATASPSSFVNQASQTPSMSDGAKPPALVPTVTAIRVVGMPAAPTATPFPLVPDRIVIPAIHLDAPVIVSAFRLLAVDGTMFRQWEAPNQFAAGWQSTSATLGVPGNTVLSGHHNIDGEVFGHLVDLKSGDTIQMYSGRTVIVYQVTNKMILAEKGQSMTVRLDNARWLDPSTDERLTLITCWPAWTNTHRLIIVAQPVGGGQLNRSALP